MTKIYRQSNVNASSSTTTARVPVLKDISNASPAAGEIGGIVFSKAQNTFYGRYKSSWKPIGYGGSTPYGIEYPINGIVDPDITTSIVTSAAEKDLGGTVQWATRMAGTSGINNITAYSNCVNDSGESVCIGNYDFDTGTTLYIYNANGSTGATLLFSAIGSNTDCFIAKYTSSGEVDWATRLATATGNSVIGNSAFINESGEVYCTGYYNTNTLYIYNSNGTTGAQLANSGGDGDAFVVKFTPGGDVDWATRLAGSGTDYGYGISVNTSGDVICFGSYNSSPLYIYNANGTTAAQLANSENFDVFVVQFTSNGTMDWATRLAGTGSDGGRGVSVNASGNVVCTGVYESNPLYIYNANGTAAAQLDFSGGGGDVFVVQFTSNGTMDWATRLAGSGSDYGNGVSVNASGDVLCTGYYSSNPLYIYNANGTTAAQLANSGISDVFVAKFTPSGSLDWATSMGGTGTDSGRGVSVNANGDVLCSGFYTSSPLYIYNANGTTGTQLANSGDEDTFVVKFTPGGDVDWATRIVGTGSDYGYGVSVNNLGDVLCIGSYHSSPLYIYNASGTTGASLAINPTSNAYLVKYNSTELYKMSIASATTSGTLKNVAFRGSSDSIGQLETTVTNGFNDGGEYVKFEPNSAVEMVRDATNDTWQVLGGDFAIVQSEN